MSDVTIAPAALRVVGRAVPRHDARDKVAAATAYAADWALPGMLHAGVLRSPHPSARITRLDTTAAAALPGVAVVLTARDVPRNTLSTDVPGQTTAVGPLRATLHVLDTADHGYKILKKSRTSPEDVFVEMARVVREWAAK